MRYLIVGAGGTGGSIAGYLHAAGQSVTLLDQGQHLTAIQQQGLTIHRLSGGQLVLADIEAKSSVEYQEQADVIFVCVKSYSIQDILPLLARAAHRDTVIIPILNIYGTGAKLAQHLPNLTICDGCIYIAAEISAPGEILHRGEIFRVIFGSRDPAQRLAIFDEIAADLQASGIDGRVADDILSAALHKYALISGMAAVGALLDVEAGAFQQADSEARLLFITLLEEMQLLARAMGVWLREDLVAETLAMVDALGPTMTTSAQKDLKKGGPSELDGLVFEVVRMAEHWGVELPQYERVSRRLGF